MYLPNQILDEVEKNWEQFAEKDASTVNKEACKSIVENSVNYLGSIGSGKTFDEEEFNGKYSTADPMGFEKNLKPVVIGIVTAIINTGEITEQ